jgi:Integrase core domain
MAQGGLSSLLALEITATRRATAGSSPRWICALSQRLASTCSMPSSLSGTTVEPLSGSGSQDIRQRNGLRVRITEAFPWNETPRYLIRDRDSVFGAIDKRRLRATGKRDKPIAPSSPWQNGFAERLIGSIHRECVDHIIVLGEAHLRRILRSYARYYNEVRTHRSLKKDAPKKDAPVSRPVQRIGLVKSHPILGGLHHHYVRI